MRVRKITRKDLYERVWTEPMTRLAEVYGMSDVGLAKLCTRFEIPRPPRGYWAKKEFGKEPPKRPLPHPEKDFEIDLRDPIEGEIRSPSVRDGVNQIVVQERRNESPIRVAESLHGAHALVSRANEQLQGARTDDTNIIILPGTAVLAIHVSKSSLHRALRIADALLKGLEERGYRVALGPTVTILDTEIAFSMAEVLDVQQQESDNFEFDGRYEFGHSRFDKKRVPSGRLVLRIHEADRSRAQGCRKSWRDGDETKLEDCLNKFVGGLVTFAVRVKEHQKEQERQAEKRRDDELRREEEARQRTERRKQYIAERARVDALLQEAKNRRQSQDLRDYIEAVRQNQLRQFWSDRARERIGDVGAVGEPTGGSTRPAVREPAVDPRH